MNRRQLSPFLLEIILAITLLNSFAIFKLYRRIPPRPVPAQAEPAAPLVDVDLKDEVFMGDTAAPVTIVEFTDYECSFSSRHFEETLPQIVQDFVTAGTVRIAVKNFPLDFHAQALKAAEAAECACEQGKLWEMHEVLFINRTNLGVDNFKIWAREIGLDGRRFDECLDSGAMTGKVEEDIAAGRAYGVRGTPSFFINGKPLTGAKPFRAFEAAIQEALSGQVCSEEPEG